MAATEPVDIVELGVGFGGAPVPLVGRDLASIDAIDFRALDARSASLQQDVARPDRFRVFGDQGPLLTRCGDGRGEQTEHRRAELAGRAIQDVRVARHKR